MTRLGQLLRDVRFSDKPSECSLSTFSANTTGSTKEALVVLRAADDWSMLVRVAGGQPDRNEGRVDEKFQIHPMLAPRWDLPIARRGSLALNGKEVSAIFAPASLDEFNAVVEKRVGAMNAPFFGKARRASTPMLPGMQDG
jgi:hypothetical protein